MASEATLCEESNTGFLIALTVYILEGKKARGRHIFAYDHTARNKLHISITINNQANPRRKKYRDNRAPMKNETADVNARRPIIH